VLPDVNLSWLGCGTGGATLPLFHCFIVSLSACRLRLLSINNCDSSSQDSTRKTRRLAPQQTLSPSHCAEPSPIAAFHAHPPPQPIPSPSPSALCLIPPYMPESQPACPQSKFLSSIPHPAQHQRVQPSPDSPPFIASPHRLGLSYPRPKRAPQRPRRALILSLDRTSFYNTHLLAHACSLFPRRTRAAEATKPP
jgi:hypothetical protein